MLKHWHPWPVHLNRPPKVGPVDDENQDCGQGNPANQSEAQPEQPHSESLAHEDPKELLTNGPDGAVHRQLGYPLPGQDQQRQGNSADGDEEAHGLEQPRDGKSLVKDLEDPLAQAAVAPDAEWRPGIARLQLIDHHFRITAGLQVKGNAVHGTRSEVALHRAEVHDDQSATR